MTVTDALLAVVEGLGIAVRLSWALAAIVLMSERGSGRLRAASVWVISELRPFYLPAVGLRIADLVVHGEMTGWNIFFSASALALWWFVKDEGDDRWKRRRAKVTEKIARRGARLVVLPAGAKP